MNSINVIGRWTKEHEVLVVGDKNTTLVKNIIAIDHPFKKDKASFLRVVMWGKTGELANKFTGKGYQVGIEGHIETSSYDDKDGKRVFTVDVVANRIKFLESKSSNQSNNQQSQVNAYNKEVGVGGSDPFQGDGEPIEIQDSDLPF